MRHPWIWRFRCTRRTAGRSSSSRARSTSRRHHGCTTGSSRSTSEGHRQIALDLEGVTMLDWMGLGAILGVLARVRSLGGELALVSPSSTTRELLALTGVDQIIPIRDRLTSGRDMSDDDRLAPGAQARRAARARRHHGRDVRDLAHLVRRPAPGHSRPGRRRLRGHRARRPRDDRRARDAQAPGAAPPRDAGSAARRPTSW